MRFKISIFLLHFLILGFSQEMPPPPYAEIDSLIVNSNYSSADSILNKNPASENTVYPKNFDEKFQSKYQGEDYNYTTVQPRQSLWDKIKKRIIRLLESILGKIDPSKSANYADNILRLFAIILGGFILYFIIKIFINKKGNFFFSKRNRKLNIPDQNLQENIHEINFPESIAKFELQKDYRSAIRYHFLLILKKLSDQKVINWNPEKTNKDYLSEIKRNDLQEKFKELIYIFDNVWYGEFVITEEKYHQFKQKFVNFK